MYPSRGKSSSPDGKLPNGKRATTLAVLFGVIFLLIALDAAGVISEQEFCIIALVLLILGIWWHYR
jgi:hypothetical protein